MSTANEIARLVSARNTIRDKLISLGLASSTSKLDVLATAIDGIVNRGSVSATVREGDTYTIPEGYHNGTGTVSGIAGGGNYSLQSKAATPTKNQQSITPDSGYYGLSDVMVAPIPDAYQNVSAVDASAADVLSGKIIVDSTGANIPGTMPNIGTVDKTLDATTSNQTYTVPKGYHSGSGLVKIVLETKTVTPTKSTQNVTPTTGKVLSKVTVNPIPAAYQDVSNVDATSADVLEGKTIVDASGNEVVGTIPVGKTDDVLLDIDSSVVTFAGGFYRPNEFTVSVYPQEKTATPTKASQTINPDSGRVLKKVTVNPIPAAYQDVTNVDAVAADVVSGKIIVAADGTEVTGSMPVIADATTTLDATTGKQSYTIPAGKHSGSGKVQIVLETKSATPTTSTQNITPTSGKVLSKVTVKPIPAKYGDVTGDTGTAADVLAGVKVHGISSGSAVQLTGTMPNNGAVAASIDGLTTVSYTVPAGYHNGSGTVSLTSDIEDALAAI